MIAIGIIKDEFEHIYCLFCEEFGEFPLKFTDIKIWVINRSEYCFCYVKALTDLQLTKQLSTDSLQKRSEEFRAEVLYSNKQAIILFNQELSVAGSEIQKVLLHEMAHIYCYFINCAVGFNTQIVEGNSKYVSIAKRMWRECTAEYIAARILGTNAFKHHEDDYLEFLGLFFRPEAFPEKLGYLFASILGSSPNIFEEKSSHSYSRFSIDMSRYGGKELSAAIDCLSITIAERFMQNECFLFDEDFLDKLGYSISIFAFWYLEYYGQTNRFLEA